MEIFTVWNNVNSIHDCSIKILLRNSLYKTDFLNKTVLNRVIILES